MMIVSDFSILISASFINFKVKFISTSFQYILHVENATPINSQWSSKAIWTSMDLPYYCQRFQRDQLSSWSCHRRRYPWPWGDYGSAAWPAGPVDCYCHSSWRPIGLQRESLRVAGNHSCNVRLPTSCLLSRWSRSPPFQYHLGTGQLSAPPLARSLPISSCNSACSLSSSRPAPAWRIRENYPREKDQ